MQNLNLDVDPTQDFEPGMFSIPELHFLLEHANEPPAAAFAEFDTTATPGVMIPRLKPFMERIHELEQIKQFRGTPWVGFDAITASIERFLLWHDRCAEIRRRSHGRYANPSMFHWDDTGKAHKYAIDSDSGEMVRTEILDSGERASFKVKLTLKPEDALTANVTELMPWVTGKRGVVKADKLELTSKGKTIGNIVCSVCGHTEEYRKASRQAFIGARGRMARHLKRAKDEVNRHRLLYTREYAS